MNPKKTDGERMRDKIQGMPFPPERVQELESIAKSKGLSKSAFIRMCVLERLNEIKKAA
jgi:hypothetical protein